MTGRTRPEDFDFELPEALVAQRPASERTAARLLHLPPGDAAPEDLRIADLARLLRAGDLLVLNDTRVVPARLLGRKASGGRVELLLERVLDPHRARVQLRASHPPAPGVELVLGEASRARVTGRDGPFFLVEFEQPVQEVLAAHGHVPLPPYIRRGDEPADRERYQTVYAAREGAVAAPTAGLHFDAALLDRLRGQGVEVGTVTLHVGAGTFHPLREEQLASGRLHAEQGEVMPTLCTQVEAARARGGRVVAVGTTTVRTLETAATSGALRPWRGETDLFIRPGFRFNVVDGLLTNFHLPRSSLLMLVCAFGGRARVLAAYAHAVAAGYRFYSYGDAMFLHRA